MIIPAILEQTTDGFAEKAELITAIPKLKRIQVDFCDGVFVDTQSVLVEEIGVLDKKYQWEAHVMAKNPANFQAFADAGFLHVIVHYEAFESESLLEDALLEISKLEMTPAIAINPETAITVLRYFTDTITNFTVMSVTPGKQGQSFIEESIERVKTLREIAPDATIEVDGGINSANAAQLIKAGANNLVVGSALFETDTIKENYKALAKAIQ